MSDKHTITQLGAERLLQIANDIELTGQFNYGSWFTNHAPDDDTEEDGGHTDVTHYVPLIEGVASGECGTFACVAGWALTHMVQAGELSATHPFRNSRCRSGRRSIPIVRVSFEFLPARRRFTTFQCRV